MGKDWHWSGRSTKKSGGGGEGKRGATTTTIYGGGDKENSAATATTTTPSGCMSAVLQFFDFHQFQFPLHHHPQPQTPLKSHSSLPEDPTLLKGVEAPRNSLESVEYSSLSSLSKEEEENLNFPVGMQIKTSGDTKLKVGATNDLSSESCCSPAIKTPNLVARLMGLDLLPDHNTVSPSSSSHQSSQFHFRHFHPDQNSKKSHPLQHRPSCYHQHRCFLDGDVIGTRSLPETPRISAARRSDVEHRLSLQINKENIGEELTVLSSRRKDLVMKHENERSPSHYARQIVKQVKENVTRRVGLDITNTVKLREAGKGKEKNHEPPPQKKSKKNTRVYSKSFGDEFSPTCSPRLRFLETKSKQVSPSSKDQQKPSSPLSSSSIDTHFTQAKTPSKQKLNPFQNQQPPLKKCKKPTRENFKTRLKKSPKTSDDAIRNKQEEPFVRPSTAKNSNHSDKKCKKTPLSTDLLPFKKEPSPPPIKIPQKKEVHGFQSSSKHIISLSSCGTPKYEEEADTTAARHMLAARETANEEKSLIITTTTATTITQIGGPIEFQYISRILKRTGIDRDTTISCSRFLSPSLTLHPSILHHLETETANSHTTNPILIFHLVNEFLPGILRPHVKNYSEMNGGEVYDILCERISNFRCRNCEVLEDIDAMVDEDLPEGKLRRGYVEEAGEEMVAEIERDILEELVAETTVEYGGGFRTETETGRVEECEYRKENRV